MVLPQDIYQENAKIHDMCADQHDKNVTYIYRKTARQYYWKLLNDVIKENQNTWKNAKVLELGCGTGTYTDYCLNNGAQKYVGVDLSERMLQLARMKYRDPKVQFVNSSLEEFSTNSTDKFDIIFSFSFLHHLPDVEAGVKSIKHLLSDNGVYVALHEVNTTRGFSGIETLDMRMLVWIGTNGFYNVPFKERVIRSLFGKMNSDLSWGLTPRGKKMMSLFLGKNVEDNKSSEGELNLVDYQLNEPFSLHEKCKGMGEVRSYCYLGFPELRILSRPMNHEMLIAKK